MRGQLTALASVVVVSTMACLWNSVPHQRVTRPLRKDEVVGVWRPTNNSLGDYAAEGLNQYASAASHRIEFYADGSCVAKTLLGGSVQGQSLL